MHQSLRIAGPSQAFSTHERGMPDNVTCGYQGLVQLACGILLFPEAVLPEVPRSRKTSQEVSLLHSCCPMLTRQVLGYGHGVLRVRATQACLCSQQGQFPTTEGCEPLCDHITHRSSVLLLVFNKPAWDPKEEPSSNLDSASRYQDKELSDLGNNGLHSSLTLLDCVPTCQ